MKTSALDTPMMRQYLGIKARHPDSILFYRMGDFYEMFLEDAERAAPLLEIALTTRDKDKPDAVPMCGVPVHSADAYIKRLAGLGHRVAICEQIDDPGAPGRKGLVQRDVVEIVTPGLVGDPEGLEARNEVTLAAVETDPARGVAGLALLEATTGDFRATEVTSSEAEADATLPELLVEELLRARPREILLPAALLEFGRTRLGAELPELVFREVAAESFEAGAAPVHPEGLDPAASDLASRAASALLTYLGTNQPFSLSYPPRLRRYRLADAMLLDAATRSHLELFENSEDRGRRGSLLECLDMTRTALGARRLARWLAYPLCAEDEIRVRQDAVAYLAAADRRRSRLRQALQGVGDLERILARAARPTSVPRDLGQLRT